MAETRTCAWEGCRQSFEATRADARYHSASCRAKASKERRADGVEPATPIVADRQTTQNHEPSAVPEATPALATNDTLCRLLERVADLESDFDLAEPTWRLLEKQTAVPAEQVRSLVQTAVATAVAPLSRRLEALEGASGRDDGRATERRLRRVEGQLASLGGQLRELRDDLHALAEAIAGVAEVVDSD